MGGRAFVAVVGLSGAVGALVGGCRGRGSDTATDGATVASASASASARPIDWLLEGKTEILYRGVTAKRRRVLVGVLPQKNQALVSLQPECHGEPPRCGPSRYQMVDYKEGRVVEEADLDKSEEHCVRDPPASLAAALRWSKLAATFGVSAAEASPSGAYWPMPDGKHLVYLSCGAQERVTLSDADGKNPRAIDTPDQHDVLWANSSAGLSGRASPDGLTFVWSNGGLLNILDVASGAVRPLAEPGAPVGGFAWSPDGARLYAELVKPDWRNPKELCVATIEGKAKLTAKSIACRGDFERAGGMLVAPDGNGAVLYAADSQHRYVGWWIGLPTGAAKGSLAPNAWAPAGISPGLPIVDGNAHSGQGASSREWLAARDLETGREGTVTWSKDLGCNGGGTEHPIWIDARRVVIVCQGVSNETGFTPEYQLVAADLAASVGR